MNRETELRFSQIPEIHKPRSKFKVEFSHLTTMNAADFVPIFCEEILAGDTIDLNMKTVIRMATPLFPTMSNAVVDILFFFVPSRLLWTHWVNFWGENTNAWYQQVEYAVPAIKTSDMLKFEHKSLADHLGLPCGIAGLQVNALPFRAYVKIWNDWMRDENLQQEAPMVLTDTDEYTDNRYAYLGGAMLKANKLHDRMTSALPAPQKGNEVLLPLGNLAPVYSTSQSTPNRTTFGIYTRAPLYFRAQGTDYTETDKMYNIGALKASAGYMTTQLGEEIADLTEANLTTLRPSNLWADLSNATAATINELRQAFAIQRFYEAQARGGSRYIEFLKNIFGVTSPDARLQRSEFLGGKRIPLSIFQTVQTGATTETSPLGQTGAFSHTFDSNHYFTKSFTEGGYLLGMATIRYYHWYQQGIHKMFSRRKWTDFYIPQFANLGEEPIKMKEIFATGIPANDEAVFGYQERYAEYRMRENMITGELNSTYNQSLDAWHYGDYYESAPTLGADWIKEDKANIDRTLAVESANADQFIADFYFNSTYVRQMPMYSVPGLIDHM